MSQNTGYPSSSGSGASISSININSNNNNSNNNNMMNNHGQEHLMVSRGGGVDIFNFSDFKEWDFQK
jgi:hypothetical protein